MISKDTIALVRERANLVALVQETVPTLKKQGRRYVGLCPFHKEKSPSFSVNPDAGVYHCFGCKESGDAITFSERVEGYTFIEAVRALAERFGVPIEEERGAVPTDAERHRKERDALYGVMNMAAAWYEEQLRVHSDRQFAVDELARRGLEPTAPAVAAFRVGFAPPGWDGLAQFLKKQGVSPAVGETLGLIAPRSTGSGSYDRFRHRLMFAVSDVRGRVVAFSGRALPSPPGEEPGRDKPPKYINSPETPIYTKGTHLFGLWQARHAIRQDERAVLVEGNFDVVSLHARGLENVIAPLGTAFTTGQADLLRRYAVDVVLLFDGDAAGRKAVAAAEEACEKGGLDARVATLPDGVDPDELVRTSGADELRRRLRQGKGLLEHLIDADLDESFNASDSFERSARVERVWKRIERQPDPLRREMLEAHAEEIARRLDLVRSTPNALGILKRKFLSASGGRLYTGPRPSEARVQPRPLGSEQRKAMAGAIIDFPELLDEPEVQEAVALLEEASARIVAAVGQARRVNLRGEKVLDSTEFLAQMLPAIQAFASQRLAAPELETIELAREAVRDAAKTLREMKVTRENGEIALAQEKLVGDWEAERELAEHASALVGRRLKGQ